MGFGKRIGRLAAPSVQAPSISLVEIKLYIKRTKLDNHIVLPTLYEKRDACTKCQLPVRVLLVCASILTCYLLLASPEVCLPRASTEALQSIYRLGPREK